MSLRRELATLAAAEGANASELAGRFGVSRKTLYKWKQRFACGGVEALADRSRRPLRCPAQSSAELERRVLEVRRRHPAWGGRKIRAVLLRSTERAPAASTVTEILRRHDLLDEQASRAAERYLRFEHAASNDLWQMDFKGDFALSRGGRCHPLTVLDDHSRYALALRACGDQRRQTVQACLERTFARYGLPKMMLMDNGSPWGVGHDPRCYTRLEVWLMRLDVKVIHGRPYHPQTQGKEERFHRTLWREVLQDRRLDDLPQAQRAFDDWRPLYNHDRPHEALPGMAVPASRYRPSPRNLPATLPQLQYASSDQVRSVNPVGQAHFRGRTYKLGEAFAGQRVGLRATESDGVWRIFFGRFAIALLDERDGSVRMVRP